ncbi:MAG: ATP phosphoribosyltransferase regulatory subunit [Hyphomicrobiaceae bacterium]
MVAETAKQFEALEAQAARITGAFTEMGYERVAPSIIQPADVFLDVVGESLRARTYVFTDQEGAELCLRPDLTLPVCRIYLERHPDAQTPARLCYNGSAFRFQPGGGSAAHPREFRQAGIESFAAADATAADVEVLLLTLKAIRIAGVSQIQLRTGDVGLFAALLDKLDMPERWRVRLRHLFWRPEAFRAELKRLSSVPAAAIEGLPPDLVATLDPADPVRAEELVAQYLDTQGIDVVGVRTAGEIAENLLSAVADARSRPLQKKTVDVIEQYLAISGPVGSIAEKIAALTEANGIDLSAALAIFERRLALISVGGFAIDEADFSAEFGRSFSYYTGFVFEVLSPKLGTKSPLAGGGRYDGMLKIAGAPKDVPAVGAAIYTERVLIAVAEDA